MSGGGFAVAEREAGIKYVEDVAATVRACWVRACEADGIDPAAPFVVFSDGNRIAPFYNRAVTMYLDGLRDYAAHGYVGLHVGGALGRAELHKRRKTKSKSGI